MLDIKVIDKQSAGDPTIKEVEQLVEGGASEDAGDWPRGLTEYFMKHVYYTVIGNTVIGNTVIGNTVLIDGRVIVPGGLRSQMLSALHRSHGGIEGIRALAREANQANQLAESAVKAAKRMLRDNTGRRACLTRTSTLPPSWPTKVGWTPKPPYPAVMWGLAGRSRTLYPSDPAPSELCLDGPRS